MLRRINRFVRRMFRSKPSVRIATSRASLAMERRRFPRVPSRNLVRILGRDQLQLDHLFNLADYSETGLRLRTDLDAHPGSVIDAIVNFRERNLHMDLKVSVVWVHKSRRGHAWGGQMGVQIFRLSPELRTLLRSMVAEKLSRMRAA